MRAESDIARVLHHVRQQITEDRVFQGVKVGVPLPHLARPLDVALGIGVEHVLHEFSCHFVHVLDVDDGAGNARFDAILTERLAMFLARSPTRSRSPATRMAPMSSLRSIATGWRRAMVITAKSSISRCRTSSRRSVSTT